MFFIFYIYIVPLRHKKNEADINTRLTIKKLIDYESNY